MTIRQEPDATSLITVALINKVTGSLRSKWWSEPSRLGPAGKTDRKTNYMNKGSYFIIKNTDNFSGNDIYGEQVIAHILERPELDIDIDTKWDYDIAISVLDRNPEIANYLNNHK